jgi:predicted DNA-binding mobile mystery protein A
MLDVRLATLTKPLPVVPKSGWIRAMRTALGMTQRELARRMQITAQSEFQLEANERAGTIRLDSLRRAADALGCDFAYVLIPRDGSLEQTVRNQAARVLERRRSGVDRTMSLEDQRAELSGATREDLIDLIVQEYNIWQES